MPEDTKIKMATHHHVPLEQGNQTKCL